MNSYGSEAVMRERAEWSRTAVKRSCTTATN